MIDGDADDGQAEGDIDAVDAGPSAALGSNWKPRIFAGMWP